MAYKSVKSMLEICEKNFKHGHLKLGMRGKVCDEFGGVEFQGMLGELGKSSADSEGVHIFTNERTGLRGKKDPKKFGYSGVYFIPFECGYCFIPEKVKWGRDREEYIIDVDGDGVILVKIKVSV